jgi:hypothetical protein
VVNVVTLLLAAFLFLLDCVIDITSRVIAGMVEIKKAKLDQIRRDLNRKPDIRENWRQGVEDPSKLDDEALEEMIQLLKNRLDESSSEEQELEAEED